MLEGSSTMTATAPNTINMRRVLIPAEITRAVLYARDTEDIRRASEGKITARIRALPGTFEEHIKLQWYGQVDNATVYQAQVSAERMVIHNFLNPPPPGLPSYMRQRSAPY